jgi:hypothetical protein
MTRPPLPPFDRASAITKVRAAEDAWNSRDPIKVAAAYTQENANRLAAAGLKTSFPNLRLAFFLGLDEMLISRHAHVRGCLLGGDDFEVPLSLVA